MPAINVARTDTFEVQRQKINQLGAALFNISAGGTDLSTGVLKLGDGTKDLPSLAFTSDDTLGFYKSNVRTMAFAVNGKRIYDYNDNQTTFYRDFVIRKNTLYDQGTGIQSAGQNYDVGNFENIPGVGGTGSGGTFDIVISPYDGSTTPGSGYVYTGAGGGSQSYSQVQLAGGSGTGIEVTLLFSAGSFIQTTIDQYGENYIVGDILTLPPDTTGSGTADDQFGTITVASTAGIYPGWFFFQTGGSATITPPTDPISGAVQDITVQAVLDETTFSISGSIDVAGSVNFEVNAPWGSNGNGYAFTIDKAGVATGVTVNNPGNGYDVGDIIGVNNLDLTIPIEYTVATLSLNQLTFTTNIAAGTFFVGQTIYAVDPNGPGGDAAELLVREVQLDGSITEFIVVESISGGAGSGNTISLTNGGATVATVDTSDNVNRYTIDTGDGNGPQLYPDLLLFKDNTYAFDVSGASGHPFRFSIHQGGQWTQPVIETVDLDVASKDITITNATGVLVGMEVVVDTSVVVTDSGQYAENTYVEAINGNVITLSEFPASAGATPTIIRGALYTGTEVEYGGETVTIVPTDSTPNPLYYFCTDHPYMAGQSTITVNYNNPKTFGSGLEIYISQIVSEDVVTGDVATGNINVAAITGDTVNVETVNTTTTNTTDLIAEEVKSALYTDDNTIEITSGAGNVQLTGAFVNFGTEASIQTSSGDFLTAGEIRTDLKFNIKDILTIVDNNISTTGSNDLLFTPPANRVAKCDALTAFVIPSGTSAQRPGAGIVENGAIRFNTTTQQYEGYSEDTGQWSSLGGVRDLDGNTTITAELEVGTNDNILRFYNDSKITMRFTPFWMEFYEVNKVRSLNPTVPAYSNWAANTPVSAGQYLKYRNNLYEVTGSGVTATDGNAPEHTEGEQSNNTALLTWYAFAVNPLIVDECTELRIGPQGDLPVLINNDLKLFENKITTTVNDLVLEPNTGQKIRCDAVSSLVIPVGNGDERGAAVQGSIRYNTSDSQFEGYNGNQWGGLGGVKDIDQDTEIKAELSPGSDEDTLFFYNNGVNTLRVQENDIEFDIDTFVSTGGDFNLTGTRITLDNNTSTFEHLTSSAFLHTTKSRLDFGLSAGLNVDPLLRLDSLGDIYYNLGFGTGTPEMVKLFDTDLKVIEYNDLRISTTDIPLVKDTADVGAATLYNVNTEESSKVYCVAHNTTTGDKEFIEFAVIDKGGTVYFSEYGNIKTGADLIHATFDIDSLFNARVTFTLHDDLATNDVVNINVVSYNQKK